MLRTAWLPLLNLLSLVFLVAAINEGRDESGDSSIYHNEFAVHIPKGKNAANQIADKYGYDNIGQIGALENYYLLRHRKIRKRSINPSHEHSAELGDDPEVIWVEQQIEKRRVKRDFVDPIPDSVATRPEGQLHSLRKSREPQFFRNPFTNSFGRSFSLFGPPSQNSPTGRATNRNPFFPDPIYAEQWYLSSGAVGGFDMNVSAAWALGYTGKGVVISILDDGIQHNHPDLKQNYDPRASTDINGNDPDPMPRDNGDNKHGTRCAGEVASVAFNQYCGVGVAYNSSIGGVRMLDGTVNDAVEARAISLNPDHVDIYSASWGPEDDGKTVDGPGPLAKRAFINGVIRGRHGKGSIFVWASGNGGRHTDNCNCDGYTNSIFTLSISSASQRGLKPWYLEECSSTLASTYSSGTPGLDRSVATADMDGFLRPDRICTLEHTGTSASAPLAGGLCALALEANPDLTWRDMQHLVVRTSRAEPLAREEGWFQNAVGRAVSHKFGYGLMDAGAMVALAEKWTSVPPQHVCQTVIDRTDLTIPTTRGQSVFAEITTDCCQGTTGEVRYLEHVQAVFSLRFLPRGNINIKLQSPSGTTSTLLSERPRDVLSEKFDDWPFLSVHFWGEQAAGTWKLIVTNAGSKSAHNPGVLLHWHLILHGTKENPERLRFVSPLNSFSPFNGFGSQVFSGSVNNEVVEKLGVTNDILKTTENLQNLSSKSAESAKSLSLFPNYEKCHSECLDGCTGPGPQKCKTCKHFSIQNECVSVCPSGTFGSEDRSCLPCHGSCAECVGPRQTQCEVCPEHVFFLQHLGMCVELCPSGYYGVDNECVMCGPECSRCSNSSICLQCDHNLLLHDGSCNLFCPLGYYESSINECQPCDESCDTCIGGSENHCGSCRPWTYLSRGRCVEKCPRGTAYDSGSLECQVCPMGCMECQSNQSCSSCLEGWRLKSGVCVAYRPASCEINEYFYLTRCRPCHRSCLNCVGPRDTQCLHCRQPLLLLVAKCVPTCPQGHFANMGRCLPCPHGCSECTSYSNCTTCISKFVLQDGTCQTTCDEGFYSDRSRCVPCDQSCRSCFGPRHNQCFECPNNVLKVGSSCQEKCDDGYYLEERECRKCYHNCKTCNGSGLHSCTSCYDFLTLSDGLCLECSSGKYFDRRAGSCASCDDSCLTCTSSANTSCTSCQRPSSLHIETRSCRRCCDANTDERSGECCICDFNTGECLGSSSTDKRRIALSLPSTQAEFMHQHSWSASSTAIVLAACLVIVVLGSAIGMASKQAPSRHGTTGGSYTYRRLRKNSSNSVRPLVTLPNGEEDHSDEEEVEFSLGSDGVSSHDAASTFRFIGRTSTDHFQDEYAPLFTNT